MLLHLPSVLSLEQMDEIRTQLTQTEWIDGRETVGIQGAQVKRNLQLAEQSPARFQLGQIILQALSSHPLFFAATLPHRILPPRFNCYRQGDEYGYHVDGAIMSLPVPANSPPVNLRSDVSCTVFLTDPSEYDGGELTIADTYGEHTVKLPAGDLVLYPSTSLHCVTPVTRGARVSAFFWIQSLVRDAHHRTLLFEMDQVIQSLRQENQQHPAALRLTYLYHNLLRDWSET